MAALQAKQKRTTSQATVANYLSEIRLQIIVLQVKTHICKKKNLRSWKVTVFLSPGGTAPVKHSVSLKLVTVKTTHNKNDKVPRFDFILIWSVRCLFFGNNFLLLTKTFAFLYSQGFLIKVFKWIASTSSYTFLRFCFHVNDWLDETVCPWS